MKITSAIVSLPKKIKQNGYNWLYQRLKFELLSPTFTITKKLVSIIEYVRVLFRSKKAKTQNDIFSPDTLLAVYDLNFESITFDFAHFLASAETFGKKHGKSRFFVIIVHKENFSFVNKDYMAVVSKESQKWRFNNIIVQLAQLYPACIGYSSIPRNAEILNQISNKLIYPVGYSSTYKPTLNYLEAFKLLNTNTFTGFQAPKQGLDYIHKWKKMNNILNPMVVITLRQYGYDPIRNSNIKEWVKFASWVKEQGFTPIFVPDTDTCWEPNNLLENFIIFNEPCWNLGLRMALNELAFVNLFYSSGPASICSLNKKSSLYCFQSYN